ncbi:MAG: hypothetical protein D6814_04850, partial [Calditrichaeota bacterium]
MLSRFFARHDPMRPLYGIAGYGKHFFSRIHHPRGFGIKEGILGLFIGLLVLPRDAAFSQVPFYKNGRYLESVQSPQEFLGYKLGDKFTPHYRILNYMDYLAEVSNRVQVKQYGQTY